VPAGNVSHSVVVKMPLQTWPKRLRLDSRPLKTWHVT